MSQPIDLKAVLMHLGNRLVTEHGYDPPPSSVKESTKPIKDFTDWLNADPTAAQILRELGLEWSMPRWKPGDPL